MSSPPLHHHFLELVDPPHPLPLREYDQFWYDAAQDHFLILKGQMYRILPLQAEKPSQPLYYDSSERDCLLAVFSLDQTLLAIQRNRYWVEVIDIHHSGREWWIDTRHGGSIAASPPPSLLAPAEVGRGKRLEGGKGDVPCSILPGGLIWSDHGGNSQDLLILTERGLDMYKVSLKRQQCRLSRAFPHPDTRFFLYHPASRLLLLATGPRGRELKGYFLRYDSRASMPKFELPPPDRLPRFDLLPPPSSSSSPSSSPSSSSSLNPLDISLHRLYGAMFAAVVDTTAGSLALFLLEKEQVSLFRTYSYFLPGGPVRLHALDNLLLLHSVEGKVTMVYDILSSPPSPSPSSSPGDPFCGGGPLAFAPSPPSEGGKEGEFEGTSACPPIEDFYDPRHCIFPSADGGWMLHMGGGGGREGERGLQGIEEEGGQNGGGGQRGGGGGQGGGGGRGGREVGIRLWRLRINLKAVAASRTKVPSLFPFLLRRGRVYPSLVRPSSNTGEETARLVENDTGTLAHAVLLHEYYRRIAESLPLFSPSRPPSLLPSLRLPLDFDDVSTMMRLCLSSSLAAPPPLSRSAYGSDGGGREGPKMGGREGEKEICRLAPEGDICIGEEELLRQIFLPLVTTALSPLSSPRSTSAPSLVYLSHVILHHIGLLQTAVPPSLPPSLRSFQGGGEARDKASNVVPPALVVLFLRLLFHLQRIDRVVSFLRTQQGAVDSHEVVNLLLAFLAQEGEGRKTEELEYETKELRQLVRDMLFRLRRMDLLVLQLLQEGRLVEALRTLRTMSQEVKSRSTMASPFPLLAEGPLIQALVNATNIRLRELSSSPTSAVSSTPSFPPSSMPTAGASHRAAICYLLHEWLRSLQPKLFPIPQAASDSANEERNEGEGEEKKERFVDVIPAFPFDTSHFSPPSVASTLAEQIYGYARSSNEEDG
ncbi:Hypothetical protein NocV09_08800080 [Nannochloropsis oceanica]